MNLSTEMQNWTDGTKIGSPCDSRIGEWTKRVKKMEKDTEERNQRECDATDRFLLVCATRDKYLEVAVEMKKTLYKIDRLVINDSLHQSLAKGIIWTRKLGKKRGYEHAYSGQGLWPCCQGRG